jgi:hypothetical protein
MLRMHASDFARIPGLAEAIARGDRGAIQRIIEENRALLDGGDPLIVDSDRR